MSLGGLSLCIKEREVGGVSRGIRLMEREPTPEGDCPDEAIGGGIDVGELGESE